MTAIGACGVGPLAIYRPVVLLAAVVAAGLALLSFRLVPASERGRSTSASRRCGSHSSARWSPAVSAASPAETRSSMRSGSIGPESSTACSSSGAPRTGSRSRSPNAPSSAAPGRWSRSSSCTTVIATRAFRARPNGGSSNSASTASRCGCRITSPEGALRAQAAPRRCSTRTRDRHARSSPGVVRCPSWRSC